MNKWRRLGKRKEERTFRARQRQIRASRHAMATAASVMALAQIQIIARAPAQTELARVKKAAAIAEITLKGLDGVRKAMAQWPNWGN